VLTNRNKRSDTRPGVIWHSVGRHQKRLLAITRDKALAHHQMVLNPPDDHDLRDSLMGKRRGGEASRIQRKWFSGSQSRTL
jgi:hypothetical protein